MQRLLNRLRTPILTSARQSNNAPDTYVSQSCVTCVCVGISRESSTLDTIAESGTNRTQVSQCGPINNKGGLSRALPRGHLLTTTLIVAPPLCCTRRGTVLPTHRGPSHVVSPPGSLCYVLADTQPGQAVSANISSCPTPRTTPERTAGCILSRAPPPLAVWAPRGRSIDPFPDPPRCRRMMNLARNSTILFVVTVCALSTCQSTEALPAAANPVNSPSLEKLEAMLKAVRVRRKGGMGDNGGKAKGMGMAMGKGKGMGMGVETASPTLSPTTSPTTSAPTTSPTASPSTTAPTTSPTFSPTVSPTASPTPECPTESESKAPIIPPHRCASLDCVRGCVHTAVTWYRLCGPHV